MQLLPGISQEKCQLSQLEQREIYYDCESIAIQLCTKYIAVYLFSFFGASSFCKSLPSFGLKVRGRG